MKKDLNRILVETAVRRFLSRIQESPERETRNLIDLGLNLSSGRFQKKFLEASQAMLRNENSAYYDLIKRSSQHVDPERLLAFGVSLGYDSCTKGAKTIRAIEAERNFNIPWSLGLSIKAEWFLKHPSFYPSLLEQGISLGIHAWPLFIKGDPGKILPLVEGRPDCAFVLYLHGPQISDEFLETVLPLKNVVISVYGDEDMPAACKKLQNARFLYAVHRRYSQQDEELILRGQWLDSILPVHPHFAFLMAEQSCPSQIQQKVYQYVLSVRAGQTHPLLLIDMKQDTLMIDKIISDDTCIVGFDENGNMRTHDGIYEDRSCNIFYNKLEDILQNTMKKCP